MPRTRTNRRTGLDPAVHHPAHYAKTPNGVECIDAIYAALGREQFIGFLRGQILKYTWRLGKKGAARQDHQKAMWYAARLDQCLATKETQS